MIHLAIGRRENGKSTLAWYLALGCRSALVFDPRGIIGAPESRVRSADELNKAMAELWSGARPTVTFTPDDDIEEGFELFAKVARRWVERDPRRELAIFVDEAGFLPRMDRCVSFMWVCRCSARDAAHIILTAHRPRDIPTSVRAIADYWLVFQTRQEHDLRVLEERIDEVALRRISQLEPRQFVMWDEGRADAAAYLDPSEWFVSLEEEARPGSAPMGAGLPAAKDRIRGAGLPFEEK